MCPCIEVHSNCQMSVHTHAKSRTQPDMNGYVYSVIHGHTNLYQLLLCYTHFCWYLGVMADDNTMAKLMAHKRCYGTYQGVMAHGNTIAKLMAHQRCYGTYQGVMAHGNAMAKLMAHQGSLWHISEAYGTFGLDAWAYGTICAHRK